MKRHLALLILSIPCFLSAAKTIHKTQADSAPAIDGPWLTGPLLAPSPLVVPKGHFNIQPYIYVIANLGSYNEGWSLQRSSAVFWSNSFQPVIQVGLTEWMDVQIYPTVFYNYKGGAASWAFGDFPLQFDFQLYNASLDGPWVPSVKFSLKETFPTGKYDRLKVAKQGTDAGGGGSYVTSVVITLGKLYHFSGVHFMTARLGLQYNFPAPVRLKGKNAYGGGTHTNVRYFPAQNGQVDLGMEWTLTRNWALALDTVLNWAKGDNYSGDLGVGADADPVSLGVGSPSFQYSLAPAVEYNWSDSLGIIIGSWFTIAGKNATAFCSGVASFNYYY